MGSGGEALRDEYRLRFGDAGAYRQAVWKILCEDFFTQYIPPTSTVLDLGCGWGEFSANIRAAHKLAMDLNPDAALHLPPGVRFLQQDCSAPWPLEDASLDVVFSSNFLEHLPSKPHLERTLLEAKRTLRPGGRVVLLGPNIRFVPGSYWDFWDHHIALTDRSMSELLTLLGLRVTVLRDRFLPYSMSTGRQPPLAFLKLYLQLPLAWKLFGKQFLVVAEKP